MIIKTHRVIVSVSANTWAKQPCARVIAASPRGRSGGTWDGRGGKQEKAICSEVTWEPLQEFILAVCSIKYSIRSRSCCHTTEESHTRTASVTRWRVWPPEWTWATERHMVNWNCHYLRVAHYRDLTRTFNCCSLRCLKKGLIIAFGLFRACFWFQCEAKVSKKQLKRCKFWIAVMKSVSTRYALEAKHVIGLTTYIHTSCFSQRWPFCLSLWGYNRKTASK